MVENLYRRNLSKSLFKAFKLHVLIKETCLFADWKWCIFSSGNTTHDSFMFVIYVLLDQKSILLIKLWNPKIICKSRVILFVGFKSINWSVYLITIW